MPSALLHRDRAGTDGASPFASAARVAAGTAASAVVGTRIETLERIFEESVAIAVWRRGAERSFAAWLARALPARELSVVTTLAASAPVPSAAVDAFAPGAGREALAGLLAELVELHAILTDSTRLGLRLTVTQGRPCPRFHVDRVGLRLITTLHGPGTEWLEHADVDRRRLGPGAAGERDETSGLLRPGATIHRLEPFDVGVFKGEAWPGNEGRGAVHRSPAPDGGWRLMLSLDAL